MISDNAIIRIQLFLLTPLLWLAVMVAKVSNAWASAKAALVATLAGGPGSLVSARRSAESYDIVYDIRRPGWACLGLLLRGMEFFLTLQRVILSPVAVYYRYHEVASDVYDDEEDDDLLDLEVVADDGYAATTDNRTRHALVRAKDVIVRDSYGHKWIEIARVQQAIDAQHDPQRVPERVLGACVNDQDVTQWFNDRLESIASLQPRAGQIAKLAKPSGWSLMIMEADEDLTTHAYAPDVVVKVTTTLRDSTKT